jgi:hypothetical protein
LSGGELVLEVGHVGLGGGGGLCGRVSRGLRRGACSCLALQSDLRLLQRRRDVVA